MSESASKSVLIYGAYGYSGLLILQDSLKQGLNVVVGGRSEAKCQQLAKEFKVPHCAFSLNQSHAQIDEQLKKSGVIAVMNCAGPFSETFTPMAAACLRNHLHYLDITGEIEVFEEAHSLDAKAKEAKIMILPGTGSDVVPSDCLAVRLKRRLPTATELTMAMGAIREPKLKGPKISHGTLVTVVSSLGKPNLIRRNGTITPLAKFSGRQITLPRNTEGEYETAFGAGIPWGDVSTAYYSTGIPNISFFMKVPPLARYVFWFISLWLVKVILGSSFVQNILRSLIPQGGPSEEHREATRMGFFGEAIDRKSGKKAVTLLRTAEGYKTTAHASVAIMKHVIAGNAPPGFRTPAMAYGEELITQIKDLQSSFEDLEIESI